MSEIEKLIELPMKIPLCNRARHLQSSNIAQLNNIFNTDTRRVSTFIYAYN